MSKQKVIITIAICITIAWMAYNMYAGLKIGDSKGFDQESVKDWEADHQSVK